MSDEDPASPPQLAANMKAATDALTPEAKRVDAAALRLQALLDAVEEMLAEWAPLADGAAGETETLIGAWRRTHLNHREDLSAAMVALGAEPAKDAVLGPALRQAGATLHVGALGVRRTSLSPLLRRENLLLDLYDATGGADPEHRHMLDRHRAELVRLGNRTQDLIDGIRPGEA
ncbi:hypothetical protein [Jannaschia ovalis]|uniref:DUF2383 domain-containing protein n=1 Tax=Jannaschia ovalis TaxID=3038773 RepID=A0ABY8LFU9_9RHOB|nr:hypothetical protein [Jannaschia sp. GRR-S6-38]WGH78995.1 hypothetical protein P8627_01685 [Jannaschia sp. GRR-S6-38]